MRTVPTELASTALQHPQLRMPADQLKPGPTRDLRQAMARFRDGADHTTARRAVLQVLTPLRLDQAEHIARQRTEALLETNRAHLASTLVPAATMAELLGLVDASDDGSDLIADLTRVGDTIVAGTDDNSASTDTIAAALIERVTGSGDAVALISILHQTRGATGALVEGLVAHGEHRPSAVPATKRTATAEVDLAEFGLIETGETVAIALDRTTEFGAGDHACPGRALAETIAAAIVDALGR